MVALHSQENGSEALQASQASLSSQAIAISLMTITNITSADYDASVTRPLERSIS